MNAILNRLSQLEEEIVKIQEFLPKNKKRSAEKEDKDKEMGQIRDNANQECISDNVLMTNKPKLLLKPVENLFNEIDNKLVI